MQGILLLTWMRGSRNQVCLGRKGKKSSSNYPMIKGDKKFSDQLLLGKDVKESFESVLVKRGQGNGVNCTINEGKKEESSD